MCVFPQSSGAHSQFWVAEPDSCHVGTSAAIVFLHAMGKLKYHPRPRRLASYHCEMSRGLSALLSHALVAFTIEADNEFEHRMPHYTTRHGGTLSGPWLVSIAMWWNCLRFVGDEGITARELEKLARTGTNLDGMRRWGYVAIEDTTRPRMRWVLRATPNGQRAREIWRALLPEIEERWNHRFGVTAMNRLRAALREFALQLDPGLPDCMPILQYGLTTNGPPRPHTAEQASDLLPALLARALVAFALEFERESEVSLAICANVLRLVGEDGILVRDLPRLAGVSKEAIAGALSFLEKRGYGLVKPEPEGSRAKMLTLTPLGRLAYQKSERLIANMEATWETRFGAPGVQNLRESLAVIDPSLIVGLKPYPEGWRASLPPIETLPDYPMVLHRGGFPDGS